METSDFVVAGSITGGLLAITLMSVWLVWIVNLFMEEIGTRLYRKCQLTAWIATVALLTFFGAAAIEASDRKSRCVRTNTCQESR